MPDATRIAPWWERWQTWWAAQTLYLSAPQCRGGFKLCSATHVARWDGTLDAAGRRWSITIAWGSGAPFFPPRIYPKGCWSAFHQYNDGSMCLSPPATLNQGWHGVPDVSFWLKQAATWFEGYARGGWSIEPHLWPLLALRMPAPEYRSRFQGGMLIAVPPAWKNGPPAASGTFHARLPRDRKGMGAIVSWRSPATKKPQTWPEGGALVIDGDVVSGTWEHVTSLDPDTLIEARARKLPRGVARAVAREQDKARARGQQFLLGLYAPSPWGEGDNVWMFRLMAGQHDLVKLLSSPQFNPYAPETLERLWGYPCSGVLLDQEHLELRRAAHRERRMHEKIGSTTVVLVGLGALGSEVAHLLAQEGVAHYSLCDGDVLLPGNVARHRANLADAGRTKVDAVERDILRVMPSAKISKLHGWIEETVPLMGLAQPPETMIFLGLTGHEGSEHVLDACCAHLRVRCLHAWLERDGSLLRLFQVIPGRDPTLLELANAPGRVPHPPPVPGPALVDVGAPAECAEVILPGSASNIHAAANFVARAALDMITEQIDEHNHWLFAPGGLRDPDPALPSSLRRRYGTAAYTLAREAPRGLSPDGDGEGPS